MLRWAGQQDHYVNGSLSPATMADIDDAASETPGPTPTAEAVCPFLHLEHDPSTSASFVHEAHACFKALPPAPVIARVQERGWWMRASKPGNPSRYIFVHDPNGYDIEILQAR